MRPTPPGARSQRTAIDVTRNPSSSKDNQISANIDVLAAIGKNLISEDQDGDLTSKIRYAFANLCPCFVSCFFKKIFLHHIQDL